MVATYADWYLSQRHSTFAPRALQGTDRYDLCCKPPITRGGRVAVSRPCHPGGAPGGARSTVKSTTHPWLPSVYNLAAAHTYIAAACCLQLMIVAVPRDHRPPQVTGPGKEGAALVLPHALQPLQQLELAANHVIIAASRKVTKALPPSTTAVPQTLPLRH